MREVKCSSLIRHSLLSGVILATSGALAAVTPFQSDNVESFRG